MGSNKISACLVVRNEEAVIRRCLASLQGVVDEIIIVHDGDCTDATLAIAREFNTRVFTREVVGEAEYHRPFAFEQALGDWILHIDADEFLPPNAAEVVRVLVDNQAGDAYEAWWPYWDGKRYFKSGPFSKEFKPFLFRKEKMYMLGLVHEYPRTYGLLVHLKDFQLMHQPLYNNFSRTIVNEKWIKWAKIRADQICNLGSTPLFNIPSKEANDTYRYYTNLKKYPLVYAVVEPLKFLAVYIKNGLLWSNIDSWATAVRLVLFRFYQNFCVWEACRTYARANKKS